MDDVVIFGKGNLKEWEKIWDLINLFSRATGMTVRRRRSFFLYNIIQEEELQSLKAMFPIEFIPLNEGFKYLGYFLKPNNYKKADWLWLLKKVETKIKHWTHRWLSLGGRLVLVKSVLESILVYWLSLVHVPKSIFEGIRKSCASFLWLGKRKTGFHLAKWSMLLKSKSFGGQGLKDIRNFSKALAAKSLWRCCVQDSRVWGNIVRAKYL